nr:MFS transporter [Fodinicola feengrottensis]
MRCFSPPTACPAQISVLFGMWSAVGILAEVPTGALADRFSRRGALVVAGMLQAAGYALWVAFPSFPAFAAGFVLWGLAGSLVSGTFEALLYDGLATVDAEALFARVLGWVRAVGLIAQLPAALATTALYAWGGFPLVGWVSVGCCLGTSVVASRLPEAPRTAADEPEPATVKPSVTGSYVATLRAGLVEATAHPGVRAAVLAVALLTSIDAVEEYFPLLARDWGVPTGLVPVAVLGIPLAGAAGAFLGGSSGRLRTGAVAALVAAAAVGLAAAGLSRQPLGLVAVAGSYGLYRLALVVVDARLQDRIDGAARATVTSVAGLGTDLASFAVYAAWAAGGVVLVAALLAVIGVSLRWLIPPRTRRIRGRKTSGS